MSAGRDKNANTKKRKLQRKKARIRKSQTKGKKYVRWNTWLDFGEGKNHDRNSIS